MENWTEKRLYDEKIGLKSSLKEAHTLEYEFAAAYSRVLMNGTTWEQAKAKFDRFRKRAFVSRA